MCYVAPDASVHIVVITSPDRAYQEWIQRLANEGTFARIDRMDTVRAGLDLVQRAQPDLVIVDREFDQA